MSFLPQSDQSHKHWDGHLCLFSLTHKGDILSVLLSERPYLGDEVCVVFLWLLGGG